MSLSFTPAEKRLIEWAGMSYALTHAPSEVWAIKQLAYRVFMDARPECPEVESIRRMNKALDTCAPYRSTPEWDSLIQFSNDHQPPALQAQAGSLPGKRG